MKRKILISEEEKKNINNFLAQKDKFIVEGSNDNTFKYENLQKDPDSVNAMGDVYLKLPTIEGIGNEEDVKKVKITTKSSGIQLTSKDPIIVCDYKKDTPDCTYRYYVQDSDISYYTDSSDHKEGFKINAVKKAISSTEAHVLELFKGDENIKYYTDLSTSHKGNNVYEISEVPHSKVKEYVGDKIFNQNITPLMYPSAKKYSLYEICLMLLNDNVILGKQLETGYSPIVFRDKGENSRFFPMHFYDAENNSIYLMVIRFVDISDRSFVIISDNPYYAYILAPEELFGSNIDLVPYLDLSAPWYYVLPIKNTDLPSEFTDIIGTNLEEALINLQKSVLV